MRKQETRHFYLYMTDAERDLAFRLNTVADRAQAVRDLKMLTRLIDDYCGKPFAPFINDDGDVECNDFTIEIKIGGTLFDASVSPPELVRNNASLTAYGKLYPGDILIAEDSDEIVGVDSVSGTSSETSLVSRGLYGSEANDDDLENAPTAVAYRAPEVVSEVLRREYQRLIKNRLNNYSSQTATPDEFTPPTAFNPNATLGTESRKMLQFYRDITGIA